MLPHSFTAVIEKNEVYHENFATEPYEAGWAHEARWFIKIVELSHDHANLKFIPQISPDGLNWCNFASDLVNVHSGLTVHAKGLYSFPLQNFGHWLRLKVDFQGVPTTVKVLIYLTLKA